VAFGIYSPSPALRGLSFFYSVRAKVKKRKKSFLAGLFENSIRDKESGFIKPRWRDAPEPGQS